MKSRFGLFPLIALVLLSASSGSYAYWEGFPEETPFDRRMEIHLSNAEVAIYHRKAQFVARLDTSNFLPQAIRDLKSSVLESAVLLLKGLTREMEDWGIRESATRYLDVTLSSLNTYIN